MKFLCVFCVVLCLHTGVTTPNQNNKQDVLYEQPTSVKKVNFQQKYNGALDNKHNSIDTPVNRNWQRPEDSRGQPRQKSIKDPFLGSKERKSEPQGVSSKLTGKERTKLSVQNPTETIMSRTLLHDSESGHSKYLQNERLDNRLFYQPSGGGTKEKEVPSHNMPNSDIQNTILLNTYNNPKYLNSNSNQNQLSMKQPLKSEEQTRLDLQGISLDKVKSLITTPSSQSPSAGQLPSIKSSNVDKDNYNSIRYIFNRAKELQNIHSSAKKLKRYMVVHPDGTVEHIDNLDIVADRFPNYIAVKSKDLEKYAGNIPKLQKTLRKQTINEGAIPKVTKNTKVDVIKSNKSKKSTLGLVKENSTSTVMQHDINKKEHSQNKKIIGATNVKHQNETVLNVSSVPLPNYTLETKTLPTRKPIPQHNSDNIRLKNSTTVPPNSEITLKENKNINKKSPIDWLPVNVPKNKTDNLNLTSSSPNSPTPSLANIDYSGVWFQDRDFWDKLQNSTHNVFYFLFAPTEPQLKNETKTTIYANGTTVEELIKIVDDEDGFPIASKTTKITHADASKNQIS